MEKVKKNGHRTTWGNFLMKIFVAFVLIIFGLVFCITAFCLATGSGKFHRTGMPYSKCGMYGKNCPVTSLITATKLVGTVQKVDGNKITVVNNAAQTQVVVTLPTTVIMSETGEAALSSLKAGNSISAYGSYNQSKQLVAKVINILK